MWYDAEATITYLLSEVNREHSLFKHSFSREICGRVGSSGVVAWGGGGV